MTNFQTNIFDVTAENSEEIPHFLREMFHDLIQSLQAKPRTTQQIIQWSRVLPLHLQVAVHSIIQQVDVTQCKTVTN
jgi:hypothetical protein